ncbi:hypothetical protein [Dactylosporangium salmoneum]|uniref:Protein kinase domain-containing protein n=1 Tax=Dactylosporangium salmoneum TaxID=53361 RepID=A0ABP5SRP5_9ACTN
MSADMTAAPEAGVTWPNAVQYTAAVQRAPDTFSDPELAGATFERNAAGMLTHTEGESAFVFFTTGPGRPAAVRCLRREIQHGAERYRRLARFLAEHPVPALAAAQWQEDGIEANGRRWPVVKMELVDGMSLGRHIEDHLDDPDGLRGLAEAWLRTAQALERAGVAHGDPQHDNIIVTPSGGLRLIDFDSIWVPGAADLHPDETGHRNFQHPQRTAEGAWHRHIDAFPALVIYVSLLALAAEPELWALNTGTNLILELDDFEQPGATPTWRRLFASRDTRVRDLADLLARFCGTTVMLETGLEHIAGTLDLPKGRAWSAPDRSEATTQWWQPGHQAAPMPPRPRPHPVPRPHVEPGVQWPHVGPDVQWPQPIPIPAHVAAQSVPPVEPPPPVGPEPGRNTTLRRRVLAYWGVVAVLIVLGVVALLGKVL